MTASGATLAEAVAQPRKAVIGRVMAQRRGLIATIAGLALCGSRLGDAFAASSRPQVVLLAAGAYSQKSMDALVRGIEDSGLKKGRDFDFDYRSAEGDMSRAPAMIADVVALNPAVIVSQTTGLTLELKRATETIPIVSPTIADPVGLGLAASFAHPGGNVTGLVSMAASGGKLVELLSEAVPGVTRIGLLANPSNAAHGVGIPRRLKDETAALPVTFVRVDARAPSEIEPAFRELARADAGALLIFQDALFNQEIKQVADLALAARLPTIYGFRFLPDAGGLMSYGSSVTDRNRRVGWYVAKILHGEKPGDLPIEQQARLELVLNLKTARALGLTLPQALLARADEVIE